MTRRNFYRILTIGLVITLMPVTAYAQVGTVGGMFKNIILSVNGIPSLLSAFSYITGLFLCVHGVFKFKDHVDNPMQVKISEGIKRLLAGGMFLSLPFMTSVVQHTIIGGGMGTLQVTKATMGASTGDGMDVMITKFIENIYGPATDLLCAFSYIAAIILLMVGISRLTKRMEEGPRGPAGFGTIMTFISSGVLFSLASSMGALTSSIFGDSISHINSTIMGNIITDAGDKEKIQTVINAVMGFVMLVGYVAFIRGWFVLKDFADGQQGAKLAQGLTFIIAGTLAINLGDLVNALQATLGISGLSFL